MDLRMMALLAAAGSAAVGTMVAAAAEPGPAAPVFGVTLPAGYRSWELISLAREEGSLQDIRAVLGNDIAVAAARSGASSYPDGAILARLAWSHDPLPESARAFGKPQSYVSGAPKNGVQFMVKDSRRYAATGGWGFAHFDNGKPGSETLHRACYACHQVVEDRDLVFARFAP